MTTELPEMMTKAEYRRAQTELDRVAGMESIGSVQRIGDIEAAHLQHVRSAVYRHADIHVENWVEYRRLIDGLAWYSVNGNIAVFDPYHRPLTASEKAKQAQHARDMAAYLSKKRRHRFGKDVHCDPAG